MQTTDTSLLFQSDQQLSDSAHRAEEATKYARLGSPMRVSSKVLAACLQGNTLFTAESGWQARKINLEKRTTTRLYKGHQGPVTSVALLGQRLVTGSWDKTVRVWNVEVIAAHADFVKSIATIGDRILTSSSDRTLKMWNGNRAATIRGHAYSALAVVDDRVWAGDSLGKIREWRAQNDQLEPVCEWASHETGINALSVTAEGIWSVSSDKTARFQGFHGGDEMLHHTQNVQCICVFGDYVLTGCDEIWVWHGGRVVSRVPGHYDVTVLELWGSTIVSGGLDGTLRFWSIEVEEEETLLTEEEERELAEMM